MFISKAILFVKAKTRNNPNVPSVEWINELWCIHTTEYYSKRNRLLTVDESQNSYAEVKKPAKKNTYFMAPFV